jgi:Na+:H+ antiporter, NhaA family
VKKRIRLFGVVVRPLQAFMQMEAGSGILLLLAAAAALVWANLHGASYLGLVHYPLTAGAGSGVEHFTVGELVNDGLMTLFFFVVGMEIKRELVVGELNSLPKASLPAIAAIGGMVVPAGIYLAFNWGGTGQQGWGIPMATDIAFCVGILTLLQRRVPRALVVFVTALAIFDDIGGILVIAIFYGHGLSVGWVLVAAVLTLLLFGFNRRYVRNGVAYAALGGALWYAMFRSGIHATIAGVVSGLMIPARPPRPSREVLHELAAHVGELERAPDDDLGSAEILMIEEKLEDLEAPLDRFVHLLHPYVAYLVMPVFALVNSGVSLRDTGVASLTSRVALGTALGLFVGKQIGIYLCAALPIRLGFAPMPGAAPRTKLYAVSIVAGIGFTVALFIATLAFRGAPLHLAEAKVGILLGSLVSGVAGAALLRLSPASTPRHYAAATAEERRPSVPASAAHKS